MLNSLTIFGASCRTSGFFDFPTWYKYLKIDTDYCNPRIENINDIWLILLAIVEIMIRLGVILAIVFIIYGSVSMILARGAPEKLNSARDMIIDAITGLVIGLVAITFIRLLGRSF